MVSGAAKYPTDLWMEGTLTAMALRSPYGHARVKSLDISEAEQIEGVKLVLTYEDEELASMPKYLCRGRLQGLLPYSSFLSFAGSISSGPSISLSSKSSAEGEFSG